MAGASQHSGTVSPTRRTTIRTRQQQIADCGSEEEAAKYAEGARWVLQQYDAGRMDADAAVMAVREELGASAEHPDVLDTGDPFLTDQERDRLRQLWAAASDDGRAAVRATL